MKNINKEKLIKIIEDSTIIYNTRDKLDYSISLKEPHALHLIILETPIDVNKISFDLLPKQAIFNVSKPSYFVVYFANLIVRELLKFGIYNKTFHSLAVEFEAKNNEILESNDIDIKYEKFYYLVVTGTLDVEHDDGTLQSVNLKMSMYQLNYMLLTVDEKDREYAFYSAPWLLIQNCDRVKLIKRVRLCCYIDKVHPMDTEFTLTKK